MINGRFKIKKELNIEIQLSKILTEETYLYLACDRLCLSTWKNKNSVLGPRVP